MLLQLLLR
uniref:Uncharacterized protein n=1 Tax=Anguilla anguilla TaxID=7936 RepID=A0A0E9QFU3_ANGAN